jgi:hypothetical protein
MTAISVAQIRRNVGLDVFGQFGGFIGFPHGLFCTSQTPNQKGSRQYSMEEAAGAAIPPLRSRRTPRLGEAPLGPKPVSRAPGVQPKAASYYGRCS